MVELLTSPAKARLCVCANPLVDGDDLCVYCGHLTHEPTAGELYPPVVGVSSVLADVMELPSQLAA